MMSSMRSKPLMAGDVITSAKPLVHIVCNEYMKTFCSNCIKRLNVLKKCSKCHLISYCDQNCQTNDWKYHKNECKVFCHKDFNISVCKWRERLLLRLWLTIKSDKTFATKSHKLLDGSNSCLNDIKINVVDVIQKEVFVNGEHFIDFGNICKHFTVYGLDFDYKQLLHWFSFILHSMYICTQMLLYIPRNGQSIYFPIIAAGLYIEFSVLTHSCVPDCDIICDNGLSLEVRAMKSIPIDKRLTLNVVDLMQKRSKIRADLQIQSIDCKCAKCELNMDLDINDIHVINRYKELNNLFEDFIELRQKNLSLRCDPLFNEYMITVPKVIAITEQVYGQYSLKKTMILLRVLRLLMLIHNLGQMQTYENRYYNEFIANLRITHGPNHDLWPIARDMPIKYRKAITDKAYGQYCPTKPLKESIL